MFRCVKPTWSLFLGCLIFSFALHGVTQPNINSYYPLRIYGTNLYDFSEVIRDVMAGKPTTNSQKFFVTGKVKEISANSVTIEGVGPLRFRRLNFTEDLTGLIKAEPTDVTIELGAYIALSKTSRLKYRPEQSISHWKIKNMKASHLERAEKVRVFAYPVQDAYDFDFGKPFSNNWNDYTQYIKVTPRGLVVVPIPKFTNSVVETPKTNR